jgi:hypothetical protein
MSDAFGDSFRGFTNSLRLRVAALEETGKMRRPMSPTCTLFGMTPRAMTVQFSNSNGGKAELNRRYSCPQRLC